MIFRLILYFTPFIITNTSFSQVLKYDICLKKDTIGTLIANKISTNSEVRFHITTNAEVTILFTFELNNIFKSNFKDGLLHYSYTRNMINEKEKEKTETIWNNHNYQVKIDGEDDVFINKPIHFSVACLYHKKPFGIKEVYSERFGCFLPLNELGINAYELTLPDKKKNQYFYDANGVCEKVLVEQTFADLTIILRK